MAKTVAIVAALDTKGEEAAFIRDYLSSRGLRTILIDVGVLGESPIAAGVSHAEVAAAGGADLDELIRSRDKARAMEVMTAGAAALSARLLASGQIDGMIGLGGSAGTTIAASAMRVLPIGVPKLIVSTVASGDTRRYVGSKDITLMCSVVDIAGLNRISARILTNAAAAIAGMVEAEPPILPQRPIIAASMFGNTTPLVDRARSILDKAGYEVLVFHANGTGGRTMETLIADGAVAGAFDVTTTEWADELLGGVAGAGPARLDAAASAGIPQVVAPGCLDMVNFRSVESVPEQLRGRKLYRWNPNVTLVRTTPEENAALGRIIGRKVSASKGPVAVILPLLGVSQLDAPDGPFWWPEADQVLFEAIKRYLRPDIPVIEVESNINDPAFADRAAAVLLGYLHNAAKEG